MPYDVFTRLDAATEQWLRQYAEFVVAVNDEGRIMYSEYTDNPSAYDSVVIEEQASVYRELAKAHAKFVKACEFRLADVPSKIPKRTQISPTKHVAG